jgi:hypothetical protein
MGDLRCQLGNRNDSQGGARRGPDASWPHADVASWVAASRSQQGLPETVEDPAALSRVAVLIRSQVSPVLTCRSDRRGTGSGAGDV